MFSPVGYVVSSVASQFYPSLEKANVDNIQMNDRRRAPIKLYL